MAAAPRTLLDVVRLSTTYLAEHGSGSARLDAELLAAHALQLRRLDLYLQFERPLREDELHAVRELVRRRGRGEPVAYLTGRREFYGRSFTVTPDVLVPRPETETLVSRALERALGLGGSVRIADLGTGSGCIAVTLAAELGASTVTAVDSSEPALEVARGNAKQHRVEDRVTFVRGSWADAVGGEVDVVVSNPPYVSSGELGGLQPDVRDFEPRAALDGGADGLAAYRALIPSLRGTLAPRGVVLLEVDPRRAAAVTSLLERELLPVSTATVDDLSGRPRVVEAVLPG